MTVITIENVLAQLFARALGSTLANAVRSRNDAEARAEVARAITEYCAGQAAGGAGIAICQPTR